MANLQREIAYRRRQITIHEEDLASLYGELGQLGFQSEDEGSDTVVAEQRQRYKEALAQWQEAEHSHQQIALYIRQIEDRSRKIGEIEADIKRLGVEEDQVHAQLGAIAWEAYGFNVLAHRIRELCHPIFAAPEQKMRTLNARANAQRGSLMRKIALARLQRLRAHLNELLLEAGRAIAAAGWEEDLDLGRAGGLGEALSSVRRRGQELGEELELHKSAMAKLKSEELSSPKAKLAQSEERTRQAKAVCDVQGREYGRLLYERRDEMAQVWESQLRQITLHRNRILMLQQEIRQLRNQIKAEELEAQIEVERRRIAHLRSSMESAHRQIVSLDDSIADKVRRIEALRAAGEESDDG
ncbi:MAG: hypothetical protein RBS49_01870 [Sphaerochaeta sp.]|jgi:phage host-nuclease inhibitor protein Gam|nr:hypothetical protein [Sphaerochaeta sp.]